ncbi:MAG TPA: triphosphoribosyl-dephospho-CoA synthase [Methylocella sp.]|nr:triphosphoribosyl-dephospho-CoA synthase [Methylocella sp.]
MKEIAEAFIAACRDEIEAPKPGNVHIFASGHGMTADDFLRSAAAAAPALCNPALSIGGRILAGVEATFAAAGMNTNLGIILLCAPLAAAAGTGGELAKNLRVQLAGLTRKDAEDAFRAIARAAPAGLGSVPKHDVHGAAGVTLLDAMREAASRDKIACQYSFNFIDIFEIGIPSLNEARAKGWPPPWPAVSAYLTFLARFPDSHIARKHGASAAAWVQKKGAAWRDRFMATPEPSGALEDLLAFDKELKTAGLNPGTSADLTVASIFADRLTRILINRRNNG